MGAIFIFNTFLCHGFLLQTPRSGFTSERRFLRIITVAQIDPRGS